MTEITLREKIAALTDLGEIEGFESQLSFDGRLTPELKNLLAMRRAEITSNRRHTE